MEKQKHIEEQKHGIQVELQSAMWFKTYRCCLIKGVNGGNMFEPPSMALADLRSAHVPSSFQ